MRYEVVRRLVAKLVHDVLPAALASLIGGLLFTHFQLGRMPAPVAAQVAPASPEMMQLLRDEHGLIVNYLKAQVANEKKQLAADEGTPRVAAEAQPAAAPPRSARGERRAGCAETAGAARQSDNRRRFTPAARRRLRATDRKREGGYA